MCESEKVAWQAWDRGSQRVPVQCVFSKMALDVRPCFHWEDRNDPSQGCSKVSQGFRFAESRDLRR